MHLQSKLTSEMCQKVENLDTNTKQSCLKMSTLPSIFSKNRCIYVYKINAHRFLTVNVSKEKHKNTTT